MGTHAPHPSCSENWAGGLRAQGQPWATQPDPAAKQVNLWVNKTFNKLTLHRLNLKRST
jgi:hypothetical protein